MTDILMTRRSIRRYRPDAVKEEDLDYILKVAMASPSAHNTQGWEFVVVTDRKLLDALGKEHPYGKMVMEAPAAIVVCGISEVIKKNPFLPQDLGAATTSVLYAANSLGLGTCWCGVHPKPAVEKIVRNILNIPEEAFPFSMIALGYPGEEKEPSGRFEPSRIHRNGW